MRNRLLKGYYALTPLLWILDLVWGIDIRASAFEGHPGIKVLYYTVCLLCGFVLWKGWRYGILAAAGESLVNSVALIIGYLGPYYSALDGNLENGLGAVPPFSVEHVINFLLSAGILCISVSGIRSSLVPELPVRSRWSP